MVNPWRLKSLAVAVVLLLSFGAFIFASEKAQAKEQASLVSQYPAVTSLASPQSVAATPSVGIPTVDGPMDHSPMGQTPLVPETLPSDSTSPKPIEKPAPWLDTKPTMEKPSIMLPSSHPAPPVDQSSSEPVTKKPAWPAVEDVEPDSPPILNANYSKIAVDDPIPESTMVLRLPKTEHERAAFCARLQLAQAQMQPDMRQLYERFCSTPHTKVESTPAVTKSDAATKSVPKPAAPLTLPIHVLANPRTEANEVASSTKSTHSATKPAHSATKSVHPATKSAHSATSPGTRKTEKRAPDPVPSLVPNIVGSMEATTDPLSSLENAGQLLQSVPASIKANVLPNFTDEAHLPQASMSETRVTLDDTPSPVSPFTPLENSSYVISVGGQMSSGGSAGSLLIGALATGWLLLMWRAGLLSRIFCVFPKPSSALLMPLERPG